MFKESFTKGLYFRLESQHKAPKGVRALELKPPASELVSLDDLLAGDRSPRFSLCLPSQGWKGRPVWGSSFLTHPFPFKQLLGPFLTLGCLPKAPSPLMFGPYRSYFDLCSP